MKRYFEFVGVGSSAKFWEIDVRGDEGHSPLRPDWHRGPDSEVKTLANAEAATKHAEKMIASKTAKGYRETAAC